MAGKKQPDKKTKAARQGDVIFVFIIVLLVVLAVLLAVAGQSLQNSYDALQQAPPSTPAPSPSPTPSPSPSATATPEAKEPEEPVRAIDFTSLLEENEDTIAWLEVPGTSVDHPVVYDSDTEAEEHFYLNRGFDKQQSSAGTVYLAPENDPGLADRHIVIYGHNMKDGSMFATLHEFEDKKFFEENRFIYLYTPDGQRMTFEVVAAYETGNHNLHYEADFADDAYYETFLQSVLDGGAGEGGNGTGASVSTENTMLTLSTCVESQKDRRYLVHAVFVED